MTWNQCDSCGRFIAYRDFDLWQTCVACGTGAVRRLITPDSHFTNEEYETLCKNCVAMEDVA